MQQLVTRTALIERFQSSRCSCVVVVAGAGYGKSTLLRTWTSREAGPSAFVAIDAIDDSEAALGRRIVEALDVTIGGLSWLVELANAAEADWPRHLLPQLIRSMSGTGVLLVIDDVHHLTAPHAVDLLDVLVRKIPAGCRIVIAGRRLPPLQLARQRAYGDVLWIDQDDLAFDRDEIVAFLDAGKPPTIGIDGLLSRTGGWPTGVRMSVIVDLAQSGTPSNQWDGPLTLREYLDEEVLGGLDRPILELLSDVAAIQPMSIADVATIRGDDDPLRILRDLRNKPIPLVSIHGSTQPSVVIHSLLADRLLEIRGRQDPHVATTIRLAASRFALEQGRHEDAFELAERSGDRGAVLNFVRDAAADRIMQGHAAMLRRWLDRLTAVERSADQDFRLIQAALAGIDGDLELLDELLNDESTLDPAPGSDKQAANELVPFWLLRATFWFDPVQASDLDPPVSNDPWTVLIHLHRFRVAYVQGALAKAELLAARLATVSAEYALIDIFRLQAQALVYADTDQSERGAAAIADGDRIIRERQLDNLPILFGFSTLRSYFAMLAADRHTAEGALHEARRKIAACGEALLRDQLLAFGFLGEVALWLGDVALASLLAQEGRAIADRYATGTFPYLRLGRLEASVASVARPPTAPAQTPALSTAELRVLSYLPSHYPVPHIARELFVSAATVRTQIAAIYAKLGVHSRADAVQRAQELALLR